MTDRPSWDEWAMQIAVAVSSRADCRRRQVGAVILDPQHRVVATGYNGAPAGAVGCLAGGCPRGLKGTDEVPGYSSYDTGPGMCISNHAEVNALLYADRSKVEGGTLYVTAEPCLGCIRIIANSGVARVVIRDRGWHRGLRDDYPSAMLYAALTSTRDA
jgi:dCMP deaminase